MSPSEATSFVPLTDAVSATLGSSYNKLAIQLLSPDTLKHGEGILSELQEVLFSGGTTLDGSITTTTGIPNPGLISQLTNALDRPLRAHHPNLEMSRKNMPEAATRNVLNAHLTDQLPASHLNDDTLVHLPTLLAVMGRNGDIVRKTDLDPDLILSTYYHLLCGYLTAYNDSQTLVVSLEDLGRLSVIRIKDPDTSRSQGFTVSVFPTNAPDNWSTVLTHRAKYQRATITTRDGIVGFNRNDDVFTNMTGMEHNPGDLNWYLVFVARLIRFCADTNLGTDNVDFDSIARHKPKNDADSINLEAARYIAANLTAASAYNLPLTKDLIRATNLAPHLKKNTTREMRRSLFNTDQNLYGSRHSRQDSLTNDQLVDNFTRFTPAKLLALRKAARIVANHSKIKMFSIIEPHQKNRSTNNLRYIAAQSSLSFLRYCLLAGSPNTHDVLDRASQVFADLRNGADPKEI